MVILNAAATSIAPVLILFDTYYAISLGVGKYTTLIDPLKVVLLWKIITVFSSYAITDAILWMLRKNFAGFVMLFYSVAHPVFIFIIIGLSGKVAYPLFSLPLAFIVYIQFVFDGAVIWYLVGYFRSKGIFRR
jgi:hypothetical protein